MRKCTKHSMFPSCQSISGSLNNPGFNASSLHFNYFALLLSKWTKVPHRLDATREAKYHFIYRIQTCRRKVK